jgi:hypothetical protein
MMLGAVPVILGVLRGGGPAPLLLVGDGALGAAAYARASAAQGFDAAGALFTAASGVARFVGPNAQLLIERGSQNLLANPRFEGGTPGVLGSGGALPSDTTLTSNAAMTREIVGFGVEDGIPYLDMRLSGTQTNTAAAVFSIGTGGSWACSVGQGFALCLCTRLIAGSFAGISTFRIRVLERNGGSSLTAYNKMDFLPTAAALVAQRRTAVHTTIGATANNALLQLAVLPLANQAVDVTFRVGLPQVEPGAVVTSPILPPAGTPGVSSRAAGSLLYAPGGGLPAAGTLLLDGLLPVAPGVERRLIAVETSGGAAGVAIACNGAATSLSAAPFPSGAAVTGGATSPGARFRAALAWDAGGVAISVNGGGAVAGAPPPTGLAQVAQGGAAATEALEIRRLELHPQRLGDAALAALTSLS